MRIGIFTDSYVPLINGVSTSVLMLKNSLEKDGHQVFIVTVNNQTNEYIFEDNYKIIRIPGKDIGIYDYRLTSIYPRKIVNIIKDWKLDVIHSHTEFSIGHFSKIIARKFKIPLVHTYHTMYEEYMHYITKGKFIRTGKTIAKVFSKHYVTKNVSELIVPTEKIYNLFKVKYKLRKDINIIPTGIELERFYKENQNKTIADNLKKELHIKRNDFIAVFVGRIAKEKNINLLIEAQAEISKEYKNAKLLIIGSGPDEKILQNNAKKLGVDKNIIFTGKIPFDQIPIYYNLADVFVTASKTETQGLTVIEAMAAGVTPICIDDESFKVAVKNKKNGFIFKYKEEYIEIIEDLISNPQKNAEFSKKARKSTNEFTSTVYAQNALEIYNKAIKKRK